jgi:ubiquinone/menaquinone biosynthesis C-methylase UbiE
MVSTEHKYDRFARIYDLMEKPIEKVTFSHLREKFRSLLEGKVLEVGVGTGKNIPYYPEDVEVTGIDFSKGMLVKAQKRIDRLSVRNVSLIEMDVEDMQFSSESFDTVLSTFVFCTVPNPIRGLEEVYRVLKPGGKAVFIEHMRSEKHFLNIPLYMMNVFTTTLLGTSTIRETQKNIEKAGFKIDDVQNTGFDIIRFIVARK